MKRLNDYWIECEECGVLMISKENHECVCLRPERLNPETQENQLTSMTEAQAEACLASMLIL